jgi:hypothetical protein
MVGWRALTIERSEPEAPMQFMISYAFQPEDREAVQERFKATGGGPSEGVTMLGRWHAVGGHRGWFLAETGDSVALGKWMQEWTDYLEFEITPVNGDEDVMKVLGE